MKFDDASWHYSGKFPAALPQSAGATHIGMFLLWAKERHLIRPEFLEVAQRSFGKVDNGLMTVGELVIVECDEVLTDDELDEVASDFAGDYYETYLDDYAELFPEVAEVYAVRDKADSRSRVQNLLDARFEEWRLSRQSSQEEAT